MASSTAFDRSSSAWLAVPKQGTTSWATISDRVELKSDAQEINFTLFLRGKGSYAIDEITMESIGRVD